MPDKQPTSKKKRGPYARNRTERVDEADAHKAYDWNWNNSNIVRRACDKFLQDRGIHYRFNSPSDYKDDE